LLVPDIMVSEQVPATEAAPPVESTEEAAPKVDDEAPVVVEDVNDDDADDGNAFIFVTLIFLH
jgi:hypothetical protein